MRVDPKFTHVAVWGAGKSGWAAAKLLSANGAVVTLYDDRDVLEFGREGHDDIALQGGGLRSNSEDIVVLSPGIRPSSPAIERLRNEQVDFISEVEAALLYTTTPVIAVTGTDGKSTTSAMIDHVLRSAGYKSIVCGNFGVPLCEVVHQNHALDFLVVEISAFQLWSTRAFHPVVSLITNIAEDHLEYFDQSFEAYREAKLRIFRDMEKGCVVLRHDAASQFSTRVHANVGLQIFDAENVDAEWHLQDDDLCHRDEIFLNRKALRVVGRHNVANALSASAALKAVGLSMAEIAKGLMSFVGLPHRMEFVREINGAHYYNDSKATNPHAALSGLNAMDGSLIVIAGGYDKGLDLREFASALARQKHVLLTGPAGRVLAELLDQSPQCEWVASLEQAVAKANALAAVGDSVVLAPGSSSFDAFRSFEHRGDEFKRLVEAL